MVLQPGLAARYLTPLEKGRTAHVVTTAFQGLGLKAPELGLPSAFERSSVKRKANQVIDQGADDDIETVDEDGQRPLPAL